MKGDKLEERCDFTMKRQGETGCLPWGNEVSPLKAEEHGLEHGSYWSCPQAGADRRCLYLQQLLAQCYGDRLRAVGYVKFAEDC